MSSEVREGENRYATVSCTDNGETPRIGHGMLSESGDFECNRDFQQRSLLALDCERAKVREMR